MLSLGIKIYIIGRGPAEDTGHLWIVYWSIKKLTAQATDTRLYRIYHVSSDHFML